MITEINHKIMPDGKRYSEFVGTMADIVEFEPDDNLCNGSKFTVMDAVIQLSGGALTIHAPTAFYDEERTAFILGDETAQDFFGEPDPGEGGQG